MTNDERDDMIRETHDAVIVMVPMVESHNKILKNEGENLVIDVDRLKGFKKISCWFFAVIGFGIIGSLFRLIVLQLSK